MRKGPDFNGEDVVGDGFFDWKEHGGTILEIFDEALKKHGLEIVTHENYSDSYVFSIEPIQKV